MICYCTNTSFVDFLATTEPPTTPRPKDNEDFPLYVIIVIGAGGAVIILIFILLICCAGRYYVRSSKLRICHSDTYIRMFEMLNLNLTDARVHYRYSSHLLYYL